MSLNDVRHVNANKMAAFGNARHPRGGGTHRLTALMALALVANVAPGAIADAWGETPEGVGPVAEAIQLPATAFSTGPVASPEDALTSFRWGNSELSFEANRGQWDARALYRAHAAGYAAFLTPNQLVLVFTEPASTPELGNGTTGDNGTNEMASASITVGVEPLLNHTALALNFEGANEAPIVTEDEPRPGLANYLLGDDPTQWILGAPHYGRITYHNLYAGVNLVYHGTSTGDLKYDFIVQPGFSPSVIRMQFAGANNVSLNPDGSLAVHTALGTIEHAPPYTYQETPTGARPVSNRYVLTQNGTILFEVGEYDETQPLVIDPLVYSTYLGGSGDDVGNGIAIDDLGNVYITGSTASTNFPSTTGGYQTSKSGASDIFVTKLNPAGNGIVYSTYIGGNGDDVARDIEIDILGNAYLTGTTLSSNFPTTPGAYQTVAPGGTYNAFVTSLEASGATLHYSTYLGGGSTDEAFGLALDGNGSVYVTGETYSTNYPVTSGAHKTSKAGVAADAFATRLNATGTALLYSTYLGGTGDDGGRGIAVDSAGSAYITGFTASSGTATSGAFQASLAGNYDGFVTKLNATGTGATYSTYLGGNGFELLRVVVDSTGSAYVAGFTDSTNYPTTLGANQTTSGGARDAVVSKLNPLGSALVYSTYLGGTGTDEALGLIVAESGGTYVAGRTNSPNFWVTGDALQSTKGALFDGFLVEVNTTGASLDYSTYLGGNGDDAANGLGMNSAAEWVAVAGTTASTNLGNTTGFYQAANAGNNDAFATLFERTGSAPRNLAAQTGGLGQIDLSWQEPIFVPANASGYRVYRSPTSGGPYTVVGSSQSTHFTDTGLPTAPFYYRVRLVRTNGEGLPSNEASALALGLPPGPDGFSLAKYQPESPTGNTPFAGATLKSPFPAGQPFETVNLANGEFVARFPLFHIGNQLGNDFNLELTHRSIGNAAGNASLSWGWDINWFQRIEQEGSDYLHYTGDGRILRFAAAGAEYHGPPGSYAKLVTVAGKLELQDRDGNRRVFDANNRLTDVFDAAGNQWALSYATNGTLSTLTDPHGRNIAFHYTSPAGNPFYANNGQPLLTEVSDFAGRSARIIYDAAGHLSALQTPGASSGFVATSFAYDGANHMSEISDNEGTTYLEMAYDGFGRVIRQLSDAGPAHFFAYYYDAGMTDAWDGNSNKVEWRFLVNGATTPDVVPTAMIQATRGLRATDPSTYTTQFTFNAQDELTSITYPAGNGATYEYDEAGPFQSRGNLLRETRTPGTVRTLRDENHYQSSIVTEYEYNTTFNVVTKIVDARGTGSYTPPTGFASAARYTTRIHYDFEETALEDLNGDGITNSTDRKPVKVVYPNRNPAGTPHAAFTAAYTNQSSNETFEWSPSGQLIRHTDPAGTTEVRAYYVTGPALGYLLNVTQDEGGLGLTTTYEYNAIGEVTNVTDPNGHTRQYAIDQRGRVTQETGPAPTSYRTRWTYDDNDNVVKVERETDNATNTFTATTYEYDGLDRIVKQTIDADRAATIESAIGNQGTPPPESYSIQFHYDGNGNLVKRTGGAGGIETWQYDERNLLLNNSGPAGGTHAYDANGNLANFTDAKRNFTLYQFDGYDRPSVTTDAMGNVFVQNYDPAGNVVREQAFQGGGKTLYDRIRTYDEANQEYRLDEAHDVPAGSSKAPTTGTLSPGDIWVTSLQEWDPRGLVVRTINDNAHATQMDYDAIGRLNRTTDPIGNQVESIHDGAGNVIRVVETEVNGTGQSPQTYTTNYSYDSEDRLVQTTNPDGTWTSTLYDGRGNVVKATNAAGNETSTFYDNADRPWLVRHRLNASTNIETTTHWDTEDRIRKRCDDSDYCTTYQYVPATRLVVQEATDFRPTLVHGYDANGNRVHTRNLATGRQINASYDALDQRILVSVTPDASTLGTLSQTFAYDGLGRITHATDNGVSSLGAGVVTALTQTVLVQQYDTLGRVVTEAQNYLTVHHTRDGVGNIVQSTYPTVIASLDLSSTDPNARVVSRTYDAGERLDRVWDIKGLIVDYSYQGGRVTQKDMGGSAFSASATAKTFVSYDAMRRPSSVLHQNAAGIVLAGFETRYDAEGNRVAEKHLPATASLQGQLFTLDAMNRATSWKRGAINDALDAIASPTRQSTWGLDGRNEWVTWSPDAVTSCSRSTTTANDLTQTCGAAATVTFDRDADGNLHDDGKYLYYWDFLNRLVRVDNKATGKLVVAYGYDAFDRRIVKIFPGQEVTVAPVPPQQGQLEAWYTYVGPHAVQESRPITTTGGTPSSVHVIRQWTYGSGIDEALEMSVDANGDQRTVTQGDPRYYYHYDALGSVIGLTDAAGHLVEGYTYEPYGNVTIRKPGGSNVNVLWDANDTIVAKSPSENIWFFTGRQLDPETNTYHYRARQYHPGLGQFISMDPIGVWGDPKNLGNPYAYVGNNPSSSRDPSGLYAGIDDAVACGGGALVAAGIRGAMDLWNRKASSWQSYTGEVVGGCAGGVATLYTGPIGGGAAYGAVSSSTRYGLEVASGDRDGSLSGFGKTVGIETATGLAGGALAFGAGRVASRALSEAASPALNRLGAVVEDGLVAQKGPLARTRVFYSGPGAEDTAMAFARSNHGMLVEDTALGKAASRIFQSEGKWTPAFDAKARLASVEFAARARGQVPVFHGDMVTIGRIWQQEYGVLTNNPRVSGLDFYDVHGGRFP